MVKVRVGEEMIQTAAEGNGPVNALDAAVRKALVTFYPTVDCDQAGRLQGAHHRYRRRAPDASVRVLIESTDGDQLWRHRRRVDGHHRGVVARAKRCFRVLDAAPPRALATLISGLGQSVVLLVSW